MSEISFHQITNTCCCVIGGNTFFRFGRLGVPKFTWIIVMTITLIIIIIFITIFVITIITVNPTIIILKYDVCTWDGCETSALVMLAILCNGEPELLSSIFGDCKYCDDDDDIISLFDSSTTVCLHSRDSEKNIQIKHFCLHIYRVWTVEGEVRPILIMCQKYTHREIMLDSCFMEIEVILSGTLQNCLADSIHKEG